MQTLSSTLEAAQKAKRRLNPIVKVVLTRSGQATQTYLKDRILAYTSTRSQWSHVLELTLHNLDGAIGDIDFKGYKGIFSRGLTGGAGDEFSAFEPLWVFPQRYDSGRTKFAGLRPSTLRLIGTFDRMELDHASIEFRPANDDATTIKGHLQALAGATMQGFTHTQSFTITFDATEEALLTSITPGDSFAVGFRETRLSVFKKLMAYVKSVARVRDDEEIHVFNPVVSGSSFDYEYFLDVEDEHTYFQEGFRREFVVPTKLTITSHPDSGTAQPGTPDFVGRSTAADDSLLSHPDFERLRVASNAEAQNIADAKVQKGEQAADKGYLVSTINVGQEMFDYIKITDKRLGLNRQGNVGQIVENYKPGATNPWEMRLSLGTTPTAIIPFFPGSFQATQVTTELFNLHLQDFQRFVDAVRLVLTDHETRITALEEGSASENFFNGAFDATPSTASWLAEAGLPFDPIRTTPSGTLPYVYFSPIINLVPLEEIIFLINYEREFWFYNLDARKYFPLTGPDTDGDFWGRPIAVSPDQNTLAVISDSVDELVQGNCRKIEFYDIATGTWSSSPAAPTIDGETGFVRSFVFLDNNTIWAWVANGILNSDVKALKLTKGATWAASSWTQFTNMITGQVQLKAAAINAAGTILYGTRSDDGGNVNRSWLKYTIATDTYTSGTLDAATESFSVDGTGQDNSSRLWFRKANRYGFFDVESETETDDHFALDTLPNVVQNTNFGTKGTTDILGLQASALPFIHSIRAGGTYLIGTIVAKNNQEVLVEKPADDFTVTFVKRNSNRSYAIIDTQSFRLIDGTWDVYYPIDGDITTVTIRLL